MNLKAIFAISLAALPATCGADRIVISDYCQGYRIIRPSRQDTPGTLQQVATENAKWRASCALQKP